MRLLKVIAHLLNYPTEDVQQHQAELVIEINCAKEIPPAMRAKLLAAVTNIYQGDLMTAQENYGLLFDQGRSMSLHIFEHVHGESRDRGQAMVDLINIYDSNGFELDALELPDFLPLFLEYLSSRPSLEAREWLADVSHIIARICARLYERSSSESANAGHYASLLEALLIIAGAQQQLKKIHAEIKQETPDNTPEAIDQEWEEAAVSFTGSDKNCGLEQKHTASDTRPLHWVDANVGPCVNHSQNKGYSS